MLVAVPRVAVAPWAAVVRAVATVVVARGVEMAVVTVVVVKEVGMAVVQKEEPWEETAAVKVERAARAAAARAVVERGVVAVA